MTGDPSTVDPFAGGRRACNVVTIEAALRGRRINIVDVVSPAARQDVPEPLSGNLLPFQYSYWGHRYFGKLAAEYLQQAIGLELISCSGAALVYPDSCVMLDRTSVLDMYMPHLRTHEADSCLRLVDGTLYGKDMQSQCVQGTFFMGFTPAFCNYAHWISEVLPCLSYYVAKLKPRGVKIVVPERPKYYQDCLTLFDVRDSDIFVVQPGVTEFEELLFCSPTVLWSPPTLLRSSAVEIVRRFGELSPEQDSKTRVFLSRSDTPSRNLLNEKDLISVLSRDFDLRVIRCADLSFREQVHEMQNAELIIGVHGAAMANIIFCREGAAVLELFPEYCVQPQFRALAARAGLRYGYVQGTGFEDEESRGPAASLVSWASPFVIDVGGVADALRALLC